MSIGTKFLERLNEAKKPQGFAFDRGVEAMKRAMRKVGGENDLGDKIAEVAAMMGIPGMYLNKAETRESVIAAAQALRGKAARVRAFLVLHTALTGFHGVTPAIAEAKGEESDLEGNAFQQLIEEVLVSLGIPQEFVSSEGKAGVKSGLRRMAAKLRADQSLRSALVTYARYANIRVNDGAVGDKKKKVTEAEEPAVDENSVKDLNAAASRIMKAMGVDLANDRMVRIINPNALERSIRTTSRNANVKMAMAAFLRVLK